jgi:hypothetical protein
MVGGTEEVQLAGGVAEWLVEHGQRYSIFRTCPALAGGVAEWLVEPEGL